MEVSLKDGSAPLPHPGTSLPDLIEELRIVEIEGLDKTACAGTHVKNTNELEKFEITDAESKGKGRKRIEFVLK